jgi:hypothetical protein
MEFKDYQIKVVDKLKEYLFALDEARKEYIELQVLNPISVCGDRPQILTRATQVN